MIKSIARLIGLSSLVAIVLVLAYHVGAQAHGNAIGTAHANPPPIALYDVAAPALADAGVSVVVDAMPAVAAASGDGTGSATAPSSVVVAPVPVVIDPAQESSSLVGFLTSGKWLPAIGVTLMLVVWGIRSGLASKWAFWKTCAGGYILGFGVPLALYIGAALQTGTGFSFSLLLSALGATLASAGGWEQVGDLIAKLQKPAAS